MNKRFAVLTLVAATLMLSASWVRATVNLQFNNNPNDVVGSSPEIIQAAPGANIVISLQLVSTTETTATVEYWLTQFSGPQPGVFSITGRDYTGSDFNRPFWGNGVTTTTRDDFDNSHFATLHDPDGVPDNLIAPRNGPDLGSRFSLDFNLPGTHQVAFFTLTISLDAAPGLYQIQTFDYPMNGYAEYTDGTFIDRSFDNHAAINIQVVPEPGTWVLLSLGIPVLFGFNGFRLCVARPGRAGLSTGAAAIRLRQ